MRDEKIEDPDRQGAPSGDISQSSLLTNVSNSDNGQEPSSVLRVATALSSNSGSNTRLQSGSAIISNSSRPTCSSLGRSSTRQSALRGVGAGSNLTFGSEAFAIDDLTMEELMRLGGSRDAFNVESKTSDAVMESSHGRRSVLAQLLTSLSSQGPMSVGSGDLTEGRRQRRSMTEDQRTRRLRILQEALVVLGSDEEE